MNGLRLSPFSWLLVPFCLGSLSSSARAETTECTVIPYVPYTITQQGVYCLKFHLPTAISSGNAITVNANNVVIDMNGYKLGGLAAGAGTSATGIYAYQRTNITIRNGSVRGFRKGIDLDDDAPYTSSLGHRVEDIRADGNTQDGIVVNGAGSVVRNNQIVSTGGSTLVATVHGIVARGAGVEVVNNTVSEIITETDDFGAAISVNDVPGAVIENNRVANADLPDGNTVGIYINSSQGVSVVDNRVSSFETGVLYTGGATGKYRDNITHDVMTPYSGGTDAGNNN
jgi:hypothetical protein